MGSKTIRTRTPRRIGNQTVVNGGSKVQKLTPILRNQLEFMTFCDATPHRR
jgi:hypothetical protein